MSLIRKYDKVFLVRYENHYFLETADYPDVRSGQVNLQGFHNLSQEDENIN